MKNKLLLLLLAATIAGCGKDDEEDTAKYHDTGVNIGGVIWATRNVDEPGTFAPTPQHAGKFYQWGKKKAWNTTDEAVDGWDETAYDGVWLPENDPSPEGWRLPTDEELEALKAAGSEWVNVDAPGRLFSSQLILLAPGNRSPINGRLTAPGAAGGYWGTIVSSGDPYLLTVNNSYVGTDKGNIYRAYGANIRCVAK